MSILVTIPESEATGVVADLYAADLRDRGYVLSHTKAMALNTETSLLWEQLTGAIAGAHGMRRYELVTLAAAMALHSDACRIAHSRKSLQYMDEAEVVRVLTDFRAAGLSAAEVAMMEYAQKMCGASSVMTDADSQRLRDVGFTDVEILNITLAASARNYYSRALHALAVDVDVPTDLSDELRAALL